MDRRTQFLIMKLSGDLLNKQLGRKSTIIDWVPGCSSGLSINGHNLSCSKCHKTFLYSTHAKQLCPLSLLQRNNSTYCWIQIVITKKSYLITNLQKEIWGHLLKLMRAPGLSPINTLDTGDKWKCQN